MLPVEEAIIEKLRSGPCCFDEVVTGLPNFSWLEIFVAVDCMLRDGWVVASPTRELDLSDLTRLGAYSLQSSNE